jgi:hypothetical protein
VYKRQTKEQNTSAIAKFDPVEPPLGDPFQDFIDAAHYYAAYQNATPDHPPGAPVQDFIEASHMLAKCRILPKPNAQEAVTNPPPVIAKPVAKQTTAPLRTFGFGPGSKVLECETANGTLAMAKPCIQVDLPPTGIPGWINHQDGSKSLSKSTCGPSDEEIFAFLLNDCEPPPKFQPCAVPPKSQVNLDEHNLCVYPQVWEYCMTPSSQEQKDHANWKRKLEEEGKWDQIVDPNVYLRKEVLRTTKPHIWSGLTVAIYEGMGVLEDADDICLNTWGEDEEEAYSDAGDDDGSENDGEMVDVAQETLEEDLKWLKSKGKLPPNATMEDAQNYITTQTATKSTTATKPSNHEKKKVSAPPAPTGTNVTKSTTATKPSNHEKKKVSAPPAPTGTNANMEDTPPAKEPYKKKKRVSTKRKKQLQLVKDTPPKKAKKKKVDIQDADFDPDDVEDFPDFDAGDDEDDDDLPPTKARPKGEGKKKSGGGRSKRRPAGAPPSSVENQLDHCVREKFLGVKNLMQSVQIMSTPRTLSDYYNAPAMPSLEEKELIMNEFHFPRVIFGAYVFTAQKPNISGSASSSAPCLLVPKLHMWVGCKENVKLLTKILKPLNNKKKLELVFHVTFEELYSGAFGHDPLDTKRKRKEITALLEIQPKKSSKRKANTPPKTMTQMIDNHVRDKLVGIKNPMLMAQKMSTPLTLSDEWVIAKNGAQLSEEEATRKVNEESYPLVSIGAFCYTQMKGTNKKGGSNSSGTRLLEPKVHFWANSIHHADKLRVLLKPMEKKDTKAIPVVHPKFEDFYVAIFGVTPLKYGRERKQVVKLFPGSAAVKQEEAPIEQPIAKKEEAKKPKPKKRVIPIQVENVGSGEEDEGIQFAII